MWVLVGLDREALFKHRIGLLEQVGKCHLWAGGVWMTGWAVAIPCRADGLTDSLFSSSTTKHTHTHTFSIVD